MAKKIHSLVGYDGKTTQRKKVGEVNTRADGLMGVRLPQAHSTKEVSLSKGRKEMTTTAQHIENCNKQCGICGKTVPHRTEWWNNWPKIYVNQSQIYEVGGTQVCIPCKESFGDQRRKHNSSLLRAEYNSWKFAFRPLENADDVKAFVEGLQDKGILWMGWTPSDRFDEQEINATDRIREWHSFRDGWTTELVTFSRELMSVHQRNSLNHRLGEAFGLVGSRGLDDIIDDVKEEHRTANLMGYND